VRDDSLPVRDDSLPVTDDSLPVRDDSLPETDDSLPVTNDSLPVTDDSLPETDDSLRVTDDSLPVTDDMTMSSCCVPLVLLLYTYFNQCGCCLQMGWESVRQVTSALCGRKQSSEIFYLLPGTNLLVSQFEAMNVLTFNVPLIQDICEWNVLSNEL